MVVDPAHGVFVNGLAQHSGRVSIQEDFASLGSEVEHLGRQELHEAHRLAKVFADCHASESTNLVGQVERAVCAWWIQFLDELTEKLESIGHADLPELGGQGGREAGHEQLVQGVCLAVEVEAVLKVGRLGLVLVLAHAHLLQALLVELRVEEAGGAQDPRDGLPRRTDGLDEELQVVLPLLEHCQGRAGGEFGDLEIPGVEERSLSGPSFAKGLLAPLARGAEVSEAGARIGEHLAVLRSARGLKSALDRGKQLGLLLFSEDRKPSLEELEARDVVPLRSVDVFLQLFVAR